MEGLTGKYCFQNIENGGNVENLFEHGWHRLHGYEEENHTEFDTEINVGIKTRKKHCPSFSFIV